MKKMAVIPIIISTVFWGFVGFFSTTIMDAGMTKPQTLSARMTFAALALIIAVLIVNPKKGFKVSLRDLVMLFLCGTITLTVNNMFYYEAIKLSGLSVAAVLMYTSPIFVMIMSAIIFKEKVTLQKMIALVVTFAGCVLVSVSSESREASIVGISCGVASGFTYSLYSIFAKDLLKRLSSTTVVMYTYLSAAISSYFIVSPIETAKALIETDTILYSILFGILCSAVAHGLYSVGLRYIESSVASILATLELVVATIVGMFAFSQFPAWYNYIGIVLVMAATVLLNVHKKTKT